LQALNSLQSFAVLCASARLIDRPRRNMSSMSLLPHSHSHALVWIDHVEAHVMHISPQEVEKSVVHPNRPHHKLHSRVGTLGDGRAPEDQEYYHRVAAALAGASEILIVGPAQAKLQLIKHLHAHDAALAGNVVGVETVDHPSDGQLLAYARKYFHAKDQML
jgi:stalled ribosome rescue protein Dom34